MNEMYAGDIRCDAGRVFDYTSDIVTVGPSIYDTLGVSRKLGSGSIHRGDLKSIKLYARSAKNK